MARILIVDDSPTETYRFREILEKNSHQVLEATNGCGDAWSEWFSGHSTVV